MRAGARRVQSAQGAAQLSPERNLRPGIANRGFKLVLSLVLLVTSLPAQALTTGPGNFSEVGRIVTEGGGAFENPTTFLASSEDYFGEAEVELDERGRQTLQNFSVWADQNADEFDEAMREMFLKEGMMDTGEESGVAVPGEPGVTLQFARRGGRSRCRPVPGRILMGCCLMYVRMQLDNLGLIPDGMRFGMSARDAGRGLSRVGFRNILNTRGNLHEQALDAPIGAVLVYSGGPNGHIERRTSGGYYFGPTNGSPATGWTHIRRRLTGIYVP